MAEFFAQSWVHIYLVPIIFILIGGGFTILGRKDNDPSPILNSWAVCTITLLMTFSTIMADIYSNRSDPNKLLDLTGWIIVTVFLIVLSVIHDRYSSWYPQGKQKANGEIVEVKRFWQGIIFPNLASAVFFIIYRSSLGG